MVNKIPVIVMYTNNIRKTIEHFKHDFYFNEFKTQFEKNYGYKLMNAGFVTCKEEVKAEQKHINKYLNSKTTYTPLSLLSEILKFNKHRCYCDIKTQGTKHNINLLKDICDIDLEKIANQRLTDTRTMWKIVTEASKSKKGIINAELQRLIETVPTQYFKVKDHYNNKYVKNVNGKIVATYVPKSEQLFGSTINLDEDHVSFRERKKINGYNELFKNLSAMPLIITDIYIEDKMNIDVVKKIIYQS